MFWKKLEHPSDVDALVLKSADVPQVIFKHSTRCSISLLAFSRLQSCNVSADYHIVNVIAGRDLSNRLSEQFGVVHQSPQLLIIHNGQCNYNASHFEISAETVENQLSLLQNLGS